MPGGSRGGATILEFEKQVRCSWMCQKQAYGRRQNPNRDRRHKGHRWSRAVRAWMMPEKRMFKSLTEPRRSQEKGVGHVDGAPSFQEKEENAVGGGGCTETGQAGSQGVSAKPLRTNWKEQSDTHKPSPALKP